MKAKRWAWIFGILSFGMIAFIWCHSVMSREASSGESLSVLSMLTPLLNALGIKDAESFHGALRKIAHFVEFGALGTFVGGFTVNLGRIKGQRYISLPLLMVLAVAVVDEYIQLFSGRAAMVQDVALDFCGGLAGLAFAGLCWLLVRKKLRKEEL